MSDNGKYTIDAGPPPVRQQERFSMWEELFNECRKNQGQWRRTLKPMTKATASQLASDIRNAYKRDVAVKARLKGLKRHEIWDAAWGEAEDGKIYMWIKFDGHR